MAKKAIEKPNPFSFLSGGPTDQFLPPDDLVENRKSKPEIKKKSKKKVKKGAKKSGSK